MKKSYLSSVMAALLAVAALSSCDNSILTAGLAEDAVEKDVFWDDPKVTKDISIGYFEINKDDLLPYQQMKAAGLITFTIDKVVEKKTHYNYDYWYGRSSYTTNENHYFINVQLTEEGKKYVVETEDGKIRKGRKDRIKDMRLEDKELQEEEALPEYMTKYEAVKLGEEELAAAPTTNNADVAAGDTTAVDSAVVEDIAAEEMQPDKPKSSQSAYEAALAKVNVESVTVVIGEYKIVKCKKVYCPEEWVKLGKGTCDMVFEFKNKTPFGYILGAPKEKSRHVISYTLTRYEDLGWVVNEED